MNKPLILSIIFPESETGLSTIQGKHPCVGFAEGAFESLFLNFTRNHNITYPGIKYYYENNIKLQFHCRINKLNKNQTSYNLNLRQDRCVWF